MVAFLFICILRIQKYENILPGIELFSQGATPQISSPLMRFTTEFEMDRSGSTSP